MNTDIFFISKEHEKFYNEKLLMVRYQDCYHKALIYCLGINHDTREHIADIYDFESGLVLPNCIHQGWQTSGSLKVTRLAFNLYTDNTPTLRLCDGKEKLDECAEYSVDNLFSCSYAPFFWQAIQLRYSDYASYDFKLHNMMGSRD